ncbi:hypothetical protein ACOBQX_17295 [Actinokineospora sp. G85]|uniref:hypothetical protein n=1 Tax=Actinokineospora sp. G85 TaxID=3406626 RepID=UPI003C70FE6C
MTVPRRKPLRRAAWSMLAIGILLTGLMLGAGAFVVGQGDPAGPGRVAEWPADTEIGVFRPLGPPRGDAQVGTVPCTVRAGSDTEQRAPQWGVPLAPNFSGSATVTCERPATVLSGTALTAASLLRGPLIVLPMAVAILGVLLFVPRFTQVWAGLTQPFGSWMKRGDRR